MDEKSSLVGLQSQMDYGRRFTREAMDLYECEDCENCSLTEFVEQFVFESFSEMCELN